MVTIESIWREMHGIKYTRMFSEVSEYQIISILISSFESGCVYFDITSSPPHTHTHIFLPSPLSLTTPHPHTITAVKILSSPSAPRYTVQTTITSAAKGSATDVNVPPAKQQPNQPGV